MGECENFKLEIEGDIKESLENTKKFADRFGIMFEGDFDSGLFRGKGVTGEYEVNGNEILVRIEKKPGIMPCSFIKKQMIRSMKGR
jgi:hypothetical protein